MTRLALALVLALCAAPAHAQLRGHGGPVRALAVSQDGTQALSGSFDSSAIRWSLTRNSADAVLRFHDDAVNAVALLSQTALMCIPPRSILAVIRLQVRAIFERKFLDTDEETVRCGLSGSDRLIDLSLVLFI